MIDKLKKIFDNQKLLELGIEIVSAMKADAYGVSLEDTEAGTEKHLIRVKMLSKVGGNFYFYLKLKNPCHARISYSNKAETGRILNELPKHGNDVVKKILPYSVY